MPEKGVYITLSERKLAEFLSLFGDSEHEGAFFVLDNDGRIQTLPEENEQKELLSNGWYEIWSKARGEESFLGKTRCGGTSYLFLSERIPEYGITIVAYRSGMGIGQFAVSVPYSKRVEQFILHTVADPYFVSFPQLGKGIVLKIVF